AALRFSVEKRRLVDKSIWVPRQEKACVFPDEATASHTASSFPDPGPSNSCYGWVALKNTRTNRAR
ncbi:MAG: hypothetical protein AAFU56_02210, partial [Pseudomonadota bacterium]